LSTVKLFLEFGDTGAIRLGYLRLDTVSLLHFGVIVPLCLAELGEIGAAYAYNILERAAAQIAEHSQKREPVQALPRKVYPVTRSERRIQQSIILFKTDRSLACHVPLCFAYVLLLA